MSTAVAILNQKGGSGKTPITINLAGALARLGLKALVFDLDGQGDLATGVGFDDELFADSGASGPTSARRRAPGRNAVAPKPKSTARMSPFSCSLRWSTSSTKLIVS